MVEIHVVDIETTGLDEFTSYIVEIGIAKLDSDEAKVEKVFSEVVRPSRSCIQHISKNAWVFDRTDLTLEMVENARHLYHYKDRLQTLFDNHVFTAYNKDFDFGFLRRAGFTIPNEAPCIMKVATHIVKIPHGYHGYKYPKFVEAWNYFMGNHMDEAHRAGIDAFYEARLLLEMIQKGDYPIDGLPSLA